MALCRAMKLCVALLFAATPLRGAPRPDSWIETLSWKPRAFLYHGFISDEEADHVVSVATPMIARSSVVAYDGKVNPTDEIRTSFGTFLRPQHDEVVADIEGRIAEWSRLPVSHAEAIQVLRYEAGQKYAAHWDELDPTDDPHTVGGGSPRVATVLMYLSDVESGGETAFPHSFWIDKEVQTAGKSYSNCTNGGVAAHARKGDALLFFGLKVDVAHLDAFSMHAGCPVIKGVKWSATSWIHTQPFDPNAALGVRVPQDQKEEQASGALQKADAAADAAAGGGRCVDLDARCAEWAGKGECERNAAFMTGSEAFAGRCRRACKACCPAGDVLCMRALEGRRRAAQQ